jgi:hypothetical protein
MNLWFHKILGISCVAEQLLASQDGLSSELFTSRTSLIASHRILVFSLYGVYVFTKQFITAMTLS